MKTFATISGALGLALLSTTAQAAAISGIGGTAGVLGGSVTTIDFESATLGDAPSYSESGVTFTGVGADLTIGNAFAGSFNTTGQSLENGFDEVPDAFEIAFGTSTSGFAFTWGASDNDWRMEVFDSSNSLIGSQIMGAVFSSNDGNYFGWTGTDISSVILTDLKTTIASGDYVFIDDFVFGGSVTAPVPLPAGLPLLALGLAGLGVLRARKSA
ncbi:VPLPA-CTERM sorting domain-containing protein [Primorskyibacter sp. S187A]|uniref:VPLPA-CTERM sorting domain-containing protein n=1 Tax=Primorskyibacter sp. S187A TaxID=3415130 RepID=UPI003C7B7E90